MGMDLKKMEEKYSQNKPTFSLKELILCTALIVIGCVIFSFMPDEMGIWGWILFAVGTFLNIVGIFRLAAMVPELKSESTKKLASIVSLVAAVLIQFIGLAYLYHSNGTGKGMAITTLTLCISLGLISYVFDFEDENSKKKKIMACRIITVLLLAIAIFLCVRDHLSKASIYIGTILLIEALITGKIGFSRR